MEPEQAESSVATMYCTRHPNRETLLKCARCMRPFCIPCMVQSPVGYLCRDCAHMKKLPQYELAPRHYARLIPGALILAFGVGFLLSYVPYLGWIGGLIVGVVVAAGIKRLSGYKRGREVEMIAGATVVIAVVAGSAFGIARALGPGHAGTAIHDALQPQLLGLNALGIIVGVYIAVQQLR